MGLRDLKRRLTASINDLDCERLQDRFAGLELTAIAEMECRHPVRVGGEVKRMRTAPRSGVPALEVVVSDGTGDAVAVFTGRRHIAGIDHHRALVLEGVPYAERGRKIMLNPAYTLLPHG
jgi:hypothetical protein